MSDGTMDRRAFLEHATVGCVVLAAPRRLPGLAPGVSGPTGQLAAPFELEEVTIAALQAGLESGKYTARSLVTAYLQRIDELDRKGPTCARCSKRTPTRSRRPPRSMPSVRPRARAGRYTASRCS